MKYALLAIAAIQILSCGSMAAGRRWRPAVGTRDQWMKCHGYSCSRWSRMQERMAHLKALAIRAVFPVIPPDMNVTDDLYSGRLGDILLTEEQMEEVIQQMIQEKGDASGDESNGDGYDSDEKTVGQQTEKQLKKLITQGMHPGKGHGPPAVRGRKPNPNGFESRKFASKSRQKRKLTSNTFARWDMPIVWKFSGDHSSADMTRIRGAFQHWMDNTCVTFREIGTDDPYTTNHILVTADGAGCFSFVGKIFNVPQQLNLQSNCVSVFGIIVHEIGHSLGLWHEQQRADRDNHIIVHLENAGIYIAQFNKQRTLVGIPYDTGSVMHYGQFDASSNRRPVLEATDPTKTRSMGQRTGVSFADAKIINKAYCQASCSSALPQPCIGGGYQDPLHCDRCRCADGLAGTFCSDVAPSKGSCGGLIHLKDPSPVTISSPGYSIIPYSDREECNWKVVAPVGATIRLGFVGSFAVYCHYAQQCFHWVEVKHTMRQLDQGVQGSRFCCYNTPTETLESEGNEMIVTLRANWTTSFSTQRRGFRAVVSAVGAPVQPAPTEAEPPPSTSATTATTQPPVAGPTTASVNSGGLLWSCMFEDRDKPLCGMGQSAVDDFDWTRQSGKTPSDETGPSAAYEGTHYIYTEASDPRKSLDKATVVFPDLALEGTVCVKFAYHMYGFHINELNLIQLADGEPTVVWTKAGNQGDQWFQSEAVVNMFPDDKLAFEGVRGGAFSGDIAIDAIYVWPGPCSQ